MNLVIDDAIEVKQATKAHPEESRRPLGTNTILPLSNVTMFSPRSNPSHRTNLIKRRQRISDTESRQLREERTSYDWDKPCHLLYE